MDPSNKSDEFNAALPLPEGDRPDAQNPAAELIRKRVAAAYSEEPDARTEAEEALEAADSATLSRHQRFIYDLTSSGKSLEEIQTAWHEYYAGLPDVDKHQVWQEFYSAHRRSQQTTTTPSLKPTELKEATAKPENIISYETAKKAGNPTLLADIREDAAQNLKALKGSKSENLRSLMFGLAIGASVLVIFLFSFFNERFIAPFIQPSRMVSGTPIISSGSTIGPNPEIIIPKINVEIPVVYGVDTVDDNAVEAALEDGVVHYADTAMPGQNGNLVIVGHSSNNIFNKGKYKFAFVLLSHLENGDTFYIQKDGKRYTYQVYKKTIVGPNDVSVLGPADKPATATLITCDPPGTSTNRLVVTAEQISPDPSANTAASGNNSVAQTAKIVPGNSPSLWYRLIHSL